MNDYYSTLKPLADLIKSSFPELRFNLIEIGALPLGDKAERFHCLLSLFPGSKISAFELDEAQCAQWNAKAPEGLTYYANALGLKRETRDLYETRSPMCTSLYKPNQALLSKFNSLDVVSLKQQSQIDTISLDEFVKENDIGEVDFIKIDVQGAEWDIFKGGKNTLKHTSVVVSEVEFVPLYEGQPLFGDVSAELAESNLMFHKFLSLSGRPIKNIAIQGNPRFVSQHLWSDAVYIPDLTRPELVGDEQWLKTAVFAFMYGSSDVCYHCLKQVDSNMAHSFAERVSSLSFIT